MSNSLPKNLQHPELEKYILSTEEYAGELTLHVAAENILAVCKSIKELGFTYLADITGTDFYTEKERFGVSYNVVSLEARSRLRISCKVDEEKPEVSSVVEVWTAANWFEREVYDMLGIKFTGNPDMRRIYMPEDFEYYPLRKEFPLIGIPGSIQVPDKDPPKGY